MCNMNVAPKKWDENTDRFKELILYISQKCASSPEFDSLMLAKILFFSDFFAYAALGAPITGMEYVKKEKGPKPRRLGEIKKEMQDVDKSLAWQPLQSPRPWSRPVNLREPNLDGFEAKQIALVDGIIEHVRNKKSDHISELSHEFPCWKMTRLDQPIPYEMVFLSLDKPTPADIERGQFVARELNLLEPANA
jgi:hypothetical protein